MDAPFIVIRAWLFLGLILWILPGGDSSAFADEPIQFVKVGANAFLEVSQESCSAQIIRAEGEKNDPSGIFVHIAKSNIPLQFFDPRKLAPEQTILSAFLEFKSGKLATVHLGQTRWPVGGSFSLLLPCNVKLNYDGNNNYFTITKQNEMNSAMVGFLALKPVINGTGSVTVLEAAAQSNLLTPYVASESNITLQGKELQSDSPLGLQIEENRSSCLAPNAVFVDKAAYEKIRLEMDPKKRVALVKEVLASFKPEKDPRGGLVVIKSETPAVAYSPETDSFVVFNEISSKAKVCSVAALDVEF